MKTNIYFIRHGEVHNPNNIWYGRLPYHGLSKKGREQIEKVARFLKNKNIIAIYSSPLLRARQSAQIIRKKLNLSKVYFSNNLLEVDSSLQGSSNDYLLSINYEFYASPGKSIKGETIEELAKRMQKFIARIIKLHKGQNIAVISHGDPIATVKIRKKGLPLEIKSLRSGDNIIPLGGFYVLKI